MKRLLLLFILSIPLLSSAQKWVKNFNFVDQSSCGLLKVGKDNKIGYADINGNIVIPLVYDDGLAFSEGFTAVRKGNSWIFLDSTGKQIFDSRYEDAQNFHNGVAAVMKNDRYGYIDITGKVMIDFQFYNAHNFSEGLAPVSNGKNLWG